MGRKNSRKKRSGQKLKPVLKRAIITAFEEQPKKVFNYKQIAAMFEIEDGPTRKLVADILNELVKMKVLQEESRGRYTLGSFKDVITGQIEITRRGSGYLLMTDRDDVFIRQGALGTAFNNDIVRVKVVKRAKSNKIEGSVVEVVERARTRFVGTVDMSDNYAFVIPDNDKIHVDFFVPLSDLMGAKHKDKVVVDLVGWRDKDDSPVAKVVEVLGKAGEHNTEIHAILASYGLPHDFPKEIELEAEKIPLDLNKEEVLKRVDFRDKLTFTIDPEDAKDFDDALSFVRLENGDYEIGVHIADVGHYVRPGSMIDKEAFARATSVYLVDRVVPMLPERLSNGVCSLRPNEEKFTFSVVFTIDQKANVKDHRIVKTVIYSDRRFTYEEAQERIETKQGDLQEEINIMDGLAKILRAERLKQGALEISSEEVKFRLDEEGKPIDVYNKVSKDANKLIEEFMLLANKYVAMSVGKPKGKTPPLPFVYRVHEAPDPDKLARFILFLKHLGYSISNLTPQNFSVKVSELIGQIENDQESSIIQVMAIRSMSKAIYSTDNQGHYGLAFDYYSHFTSPIRRYPDLIAHRLLVQYAAGNKNANKEEIEEWCKHCSAMEKLATEAERDSIKYKQVEYLQDKVGLAFPGLVSGLTDYGIFVELRGNKCEGLVPLRTMSDDDYRFDEAQYAVVGKRHGKTFYLGDEVDVIVKKTDLFKKQIDLEMVDENFF